MPKPLRQILIDIARAGEVITYGDLAELTGGYPDLLAGPLGVVTRAELNARPRRSALSALVVNQDTKFPGVGFAGEVMGNEIDLGGREAFIRKYGVVPPHDYRWLEPPQQERIWASALGEVYREYRRPSWTADLRRILVRQIGEFRGAELVPVAVAALEAPPAGTRS